jgi:hypothetical protein
MRLQEKMKGHHIAKRRVGENGSRLKSFLRRGPKVEDDLPIPCRSGTIDLSEEKR